ncbi:thiol-disulfide oxidoreductase DCC family protein [Pseudosulfitobacter koreensis]|uniref:DCC1-like thiol-disulfide oxidoreductase family protein n=1 Tax=Pseudosulfitobacter koreensis TaxID=2968472 RepID=A0ABT1YYS7_9RHOB|nr:DCC1-like thiol-disulfide oxidoreductase family protein [Pseudosulfitobacter koreense]MCR8826040.1 DCC1-like thiol-disulfide oxidoreductase family protein [Pseudosulfitobacter koreense]
MSRPIDVLPATQVAVLRGRDLIVFDGECVLCSGFFRFVLRHDHAQRFSFVTAQSPLGQALYKALDLNADDFETNLVIVNGLIYEKLDAFAAAMSAMGWPWRAFAAAKRMPTVIKRPLYDVIARNRYRIFGRYDTCMVPDKDVRARFIDTAP